MSLNFSVIFCTTNSKIKLDDDDFDDSYRDANDHDDSDNDDNNDDDSCHSAMSTTIEWS